jgi:hypothetical protein
MDLSAKIPLLFSAIFLLVGMLDGRLEIPKDNGFG